MESSTVKKMGLLPSIVVSLFLMCATIATSNVHASTVSNQSSLNGTQVAWWNGYHGGYYRPGYYRPGYYRPGYYRPGFAPYYRGGACQKTCWRDGWGVLHCNTRCY